MYRVVIDEIVLTKDFVRIDLEDQKRILRAIRKKLTVEPEKFGSPLRAPLKGYWKLRVGEHRVVYSIENDRIVVYVIAVGFRRNEEVYKEVIKRLGKDL